MTDDNPTPPPSAPSGQPAHPGAPAEQPQPSYPPQPPYPPQGSYSAPPPSYASQYPGGYPGAYGQPAGPRTEDPGKTMGIVGLIVSIAGLFVWFVAPIAGIIVSAIARSRSSRAGFSNGPALWGIIVGAVMLVLNIIFVVVLVVTIFAIANAAVCGELGPGVHELAPGQEIVCS